MKTYTEETARQIVATLDPETPVRRWGFEIESPQVGETQVTSHYEETQGLEFCSDPSLSGGECECDCSDCTYHECNCSECNSYNDDPDHCGSCSTNEVCCARPMETAKLDRWQLFLSRLARKWQPMEHYGENWGGHLHIEGRDLDKRQAVNLVAIGVRMFELAPEWFTGGEDGYNERPDRDALHNWQRSEWSGRNTNRASWISIHNLPARPEPYQIGDEYDYRKTTIEFRAFRSTPDKELIEFRRLVCQKLIEYVQKNTSTYWATSAKTFDQLLNELGV